MVFLCKKKLWLVVTLFAPYAWSNSDVFNINLSSQHTWDDNFTRSPEPVSEEITTSAAAVTFRKKIQNQNILISAKATDYNHDLRDDLDAATQEGELRWAGQWVGRIRTDLQWTRNAHLVDRLEFADKDIVIREDAKAKIGYGSGERLAFYAGGRKTDHKHWNELRSDIDFEETEGFVEAVYKTPSESSMSLRFKEADRVHPNRPLNPLLSDLDFTYKQLELETNWVLSEKTSVSGFIAGFKRDGTINSGSGGLADVALYWAPTEKLDLNIGVEYREPAIGEISDSPSKVKSAVARINWQMTSKIRLGSAVRYTHRNYDNTSVDMQRVENFYSYSPLSIIYVPLNNLRFRLETAVLDNQSPVFFRDYISKQVSLGLAWQY